MTYTSTSVVFRADYSIDNATASDSGTYTCTVTNPIGSDSATITVVVIISKLLIFECYFISLICYVMKTRAFTLAHNI